MKKSIMNRIIIGKTLGFLVGGIFFWIMNSFFRVPLEIEFLLGVWLLFVLLGATSAFMGVLNYHSWIPKLKLSFWIRGIIIGLTFGLILTLMGHQELSQIIEAMDLWGLTSSYWALLDMIFLGLIFEYLETKFAGEGKLPLS